MTKPELRPADESTPAAGKWLVFFRIVNQMKIIGLTAIGIAIGIVAMLLFVGWVFSKGR